MKNNTDKVFIDHLQRNAPKYFPELLSDRISVLLREKQKRPSAVLYRFDVKDDIRRYPIIVKVPRRAKSPNRSNESPYEKPSLFQRADLQDMHWLQYTALTSIYEYFDHVNSEQLGAIHVLDYLPEYHAIFMEESGDPSLQRLFMKQNRFHGMFKNRDLLSAFQNAGKWLQKYHTMPKENGVQVRHQHREDYIEAIVLLTEFLSRAWGDRAFFKHTASVIIQNSRETLPESLPLGLGHGDYAMRNILVGPKYRVTVLDTFAKWRAPIFEDIGYFLNSFRSSYSQVISQGFLFGRGQLAEYESAFLQGYFDSGNIPYWDIRLYEILAVLDKWSSLVDHYHKRSARFRYFGETKVILASRYFKSYTKFLLNQIEGVEKRSTLSAMERSF